MSSLTLPDGWPVYSISTKARGSAAEAQAAGLAHLEWIAQEQATGALEVAPRLVPARVERSLNARGAALPGPTEAPGYRRGGGSGVGRSGEILLAPEEDRAHAVTPLSARRSEIWLAGTVALLLAVCLAWAGRHVLTIRTILGGSGATLGELYVLTFAVLAWQVVLYTIDRPYRASTPERAVLDSLNVTVAVPCYNEDPGILRQSLLSMLAQTRLPDHVYIVDDGSTAADYTDVRREFAERAAATGVRSTWVRTENGGKRHAHAVAVQGTPDADVYVTIDSDGILSETAIAELLAPFTDPDIQSVAGIVLAANNRSTLLARILDLIYLPSQLTGRAGLSVMGSVLVNSGALAAYRANAVREALPVYLGETFFGRPVGFSDDSMLTLHAYLRGRTVQQASAFVFAAMPERFSHHMRQYLRWMRGSFIRSWWRFRYLPVLSYAYWWHLLGWVMSAVSTWAFAELYVLAPARGEFHLSYLLVPVLLGYGAGLPYLTVARSDEPFWSRFATWLLAPLATVWAFTVLRVWRWYGAATCRRTGWGTRKKIELALDRQQ